MQEKKHQNNCNGNLYKKFDLKKLRDLIDWSYFFGQWDMGGRFPEIFDHPAKGVEAKKLYDDAIAMLENLDVDINAGYRIFSGRQLRDDIMLRTCHCCPGEVRVPMLRNQTSHFRSLSDYVTNNYSKITMFALCVHNNSVQESDYETFMSDILCNRLADAMQTFLINEVQSVVGVKSLAFAFGYPACPDHSTKELVFNMLDAQRTLNMNLTENYAMTPLSSCCGMIISHPSIEYFAVGKIGVDQLSNYASRVGIDVERLKSLIPNNI